MVGFREEKVFEEGGLMGGLGEGKMERRDREEKEDINKVQRGGGEHIGRGGGGGTGQAWDQIRLSEGMERTNEDNGMVQKKR